VERPKAARRQGSGFARFDYGFSTGVFGMLVAFRGYLQKMAVLTTPIYSNFYKPEQQEL
jgi:hypothetical protein